MAPERVPKAGKAWQQEDGTETVAGARAEKRSRDRELELGIPYAMVLTCLKAETFNTVPHTVAATNYGKFWLQLQSCNFAPIVNCGVNICVFQQSWATLVKGSFTPMGP